MELNKKNFRIIERIMKGVASHRRIEMLTLLEETPEMSVIEIAEALKIDFKNASAHLRRLQIAGLVMKRNAGPAVRHKLTKTGLAILMFVRTLE